ncbi:DHHA1 domain-containing protein [Halobacteriaceae archaeon GCM10025711]
MTDYRAPAEPTVRSFEATVEAVDGRDVWLDRTYFYAEGGGQPADRGTIDGVQVEDVQKADGDVVHTLTEAPAFDAGDGVVGEIDDVFRTYCMRAHTASHVLYGAGRRVLDDVGYGGFDIDDEKVRVDFTTSTDIDDEVLVELERLTNRAVWDSRAVSWEEVSKEEALADDDIAFNVATEEGVFSDSDTVRVVTVEDWDVAACGGTHVPNTEEIGPVTLLDRSNPGEGLTRVEFTVGPSAVERRAEERSAAMRAARVLGVGVDDLPDEAERVLGELDDLEAELAALKDEVLDARLGDLTAVERDGKQWLVGAVDGFGPNEVGDRIKPLAGDEADVVALSGGDGGAYVVVASTGDVDAGDVVSEVTGEFGGGGGGSPTFAQGGGMDAEPDDVIAYLSG